MIRTYNLINCVKTAAAVCAQPVSLLVILLMFTASSAWAAPKGGRWGADYFPNVELINQDGKTMRFFDDMIKDKVVALNFIYTSCADACPAETAKLRKVQEELGDIIGRDVFMYSISIDPEYDTPEVLKAYTEKFNVEPGWNFMTGSLEDITLLQKKLGLLRAALPAEDLDNHAISLIVGNQATGKWMKRSPFENPKILANLLSNVLFNHSGRKIAGNDYKTASRLRSRSEGELMFRDRCSSCHRVDDKDGMGPGLAGVTIRRDQDWLKRWLKEPDKMLAEEDPIAMEMFLRFRELPMPNLQLSNSDVEKLLQYLSEVDKAIIGKH